MPHFPGTGAIFGIVSEEGQVKDGAPVYLYDMRRDIGVGEAIVIGKRFTREDGGFEFAGLDVNYADYMLMTSDEDGVLPKNALVQDRIQPIPAHMGSGQIYEWYARALRANALAGYIGINFKDDSAGASPPKPLTLGGRFLEGGLSDSTWVPAVSPPAEIPHLNMRVHPSNGEADFLFEPERTHGETQTAASIELYVNLDNLFSAAAMSADQYVFVGAFPSRTLTGSSLNYSRVFALKIYADKTCDVFCRSNYIEEAHSVNLSAYSGDQHIFAVWRSATNTELWVGETNLLQEQLAMALTGNGSSTVAPLSFTTSSNEYGSAVPEEDTQIGLAVYYESALTSQQISDLHNALYNNTLTSIASGYAAEVMKDYPLMYWRMDDFVQGVRTYFSSELESQTITQGEPWQFGRLELNGISSNVVGPIASPIAGRNAFGSDGTMYWRGTAAAFRTNSLRDRVTCSFWIRPETNVPNAEELLFLISKGNYAYGASPESQLYMAVRRGVDKRIIFEIYESGAVNRYTFTHELPINQWVMCDIVVDKTFEENPDGIIKLYTATESTAPVLQQSIQCNTAADLYHTDWSDTWNVGIQYRYDVGSSTSLTYRSLGQVVRVMNDGYVGSMCELAIFPEALSLERITSRWEARNTV